VQRSWVSQTANVDSSLGFLLPSQYGSNNLYESESNSEQIVSIRSIRRVLTIKDGGMDNAFPPMRSHAPSSGPPAFSHAISSSPALYQSRPAAPPARRLDGPPVSSAESSYNSGFPRISSPYGAAPASDYSMASSQTIPSISGLTQGPLSPPISHNSSSMMGQFNQSIPRFVEQSQ